MHGKTFVIEARGVSSANKYVIAAELNGEVPDPHGSGTQRLWEVESLR
jgi:hypothetical protein